MGIHTHLKQFHIKWYIGIIILKNKDSLVTQTAETVHLENKSLLFSLL